SEFAAHHRLTTVQAAQYLGSYKALELYDRQYGYLHTQSFASNVRDLSAYCRRMGGTLLSHFTMVPTFGKIVVRSMVRQNDKLELTNSYQ
ncbi:MAG: DUF3791 domain-containing protein, partial [Prevotella sp.]|nr:DUF3791 domain-containing protein [Prevotella sp.]